MSWFKRHFAAVAEPPGVTQKPVEDLVRKFGWSHTVGEGWSCENFMDQPDVTTPEMCYAVMSKVAATPGASGVFNPGLIMVPGQYPLIVSTSKPRPLSLVTGMRTSDATGALIKLLIDQGYKVTFVEGSAFVLFGR
jgi:hypothetical protein